MRSTTFVTSIESLSYTIAHATVDIYNFRVDDNEGESCIGFYLINGHDLMVKLGLLYNFRHQVILWGGATVLMNPEVF